MSKNHSTNIILEMYLFTFYCKCCKRYSYLDENIPFNSSFFRMAQGFL